MFVNNVVNNVFVNNMFVNNVVNNVFVDNMFVNNMFVNNVVNNVFINNMFVNNVFINNVFVNNVVVTTERKHLSHLKEEVDTIGGSSATKPQECHHPFLHPRYFLHFLFTNFPTRKTVNNHHNAI